MDRLNRRKFTPAEFDKTLPKSVRRTSEFTTLKAMCSFKCSRCKYEWTVRAKRGWFGCNNCRDKTPVNKKTNETYLVQLRDQHEDIIALEEYKGADTPILHIHTFCQHEWKARPLNILRGRGCPRCKLRMKSVKLGRKDVLVRGYEDKAVKLLLKKFKPAQIRVHSEKVVPNFQYVFRGSNRVYFPDMHVPHINTIVEVKSMSTIGLCGNMYKSRPSELFYLTKAKHNAVIAAGFKFKLLIVQENGNELKCPKDWAQLTFSEFKQCFLCAGKFQKR